MAAFEYRPTLNPYAASLGEILLHGNDAAAHAAEQIGQANARARLISGDVWGRAIAQAGQIPSQIAEDVRRTKVANADAALRDSQTRENNQQIDARTAAQTHAEKGLQLLGQLHQQYGDDYDQIADGLTNAGYADAGEKYRQSGAATADHKKAIVQSYAKAVGSAAMRAKTPEDFLLDLDQYASAGLITPQQRSGFVETLKQAGPDGFDAWKDRTVTWADGIVPPKTLKEGDTEVGGVSGKPLASVPKPRKTTVINGQLVDDATGDPIGAPIPPQHPIVPKSFQQKSVLVDGKPAEVLFDPDPASKSPYLTLDKQPIENAAARVKPIPPASTRVQVGGSNSPGDWNKQGAEFLATIPAQWRQTVQKIANYDEDPTKVASMRGGMRETLMQWVNQVNPGYDQSQFTNRAPTRKAFTIGTQGQQINAINTAIGHIDQLGAIVDRLGNGSFTPGNALWNDVRTLFGSDKVTNFDTLKDALSGEVASVLSKSGATVSGIADAKQKMSAANSPQQLLGYVKTQIPIMGSKLAELDYQYHQAMGADDAFSALSPRSKAVLERLGFDPAHPEISQGAQSDRVRVKGPNGQRGTVPKGTTLSNGWSFE